MRAVQRGDHLVKRCGPYTHHAIYDAAGVVIHFSGVRDGKVTASIREGTIAELADEHGYVEVVKYARCFDPDTVVRRARSRLGQRGYHLLNDNCEHLARWCKTGEHHSDQVHRATTTAIGITHGSGLGALGVGAVAASGAAATGGAQVMTGLKAIGGSALAGVAVVTAAPAVVGAIAANKVWRDDPMLAEPERIARQKARVAANMGALVGWAAVFALVSGLGQRGRSAAGISSGLARAGFGSMNRGLIALALVPVASAFIAGAVAHRSARG